MTLNECCWIHIPQSLSNCSKTPLNLQSWELTPAQICLTHRLNCLSFTFSTELCPPHPTSLPQSSPSIPSSASPGSVCVRSPQTLKILFFILSCYVLYISVFIRSMLSLFKSPSSPSSSLFPSLHPHFKSYLSLSTSHNPIHLLVSTSSITPPLLRLIWTFCLGFIHPSISLSSRV